MFLHIYLYGKIKLTSCPLTFVYVHVMMCMFDNHDKHTKRCWSLYPSRK